MIVNVKRVVEETLNELSRQGIDTSTTEFAFFEQELVQRLSRELASQDARLADIPQHAAGKFETYTVIPADGPYAQATIESRFDGQGIYAYVRLENGNYMDLTEQYNDWLAKQPKINRVTFEWPAEEGKN